MYNIGNVMKAAGARRTHRASKREGRSRSADSQWSAGEEPGTEPRCFSARSPCSVVRIQPGPRMR